MVEIIDAVARPRRRGGRAADHRADRDRDERPAADDGDPLDLALRALRRPAHLRGRHRQLFRAPAGVRAPAGRRAARRRHAPARAALLPLGARLPLRAGEPGPLPDGAQDDRGLGDRAAVQLGPRRRRRLGPRRPDDAVPGAARSRPSSPAPASRCPRSSTALGANNGNAGGGFYSRGRPVLLRARARTAAHAGRHRQRRARRAQRHARSSSRTSARSSSATRRDSGSSASTTTTTRSRASILHAHGRAGADRAQGRRGEDAGAQPRRSCPKT